MKKTARYADVFVEEGAVRVFEAADWKKLSLRSDMRFLIERMKEFYKNHELSFSPPPPAPVPDKAFSLEYPLSDRQRQAADAVLSNPVTYVWGAPGTGKTQAVLATCLMRCIAAKRRVLLLAPTNNAVEQSLNAILPILRKNGVPLKDVYRLGAASSEFAERFPEVVGDSALEQRSAELAEIEAKLTEELKRARTYEAEAAAAEEQAAGIDPALTRLEAVLPGLGPAAAAASEAETALGAAEAELARSKTGYESASKAFSLREALILKYGDSIAENERRCRKIRFLPWKREEYGRLRLQNRQLGEQKREMMLTLGEHMKARDSAKAGLDTALREEREARTEWEEKKKALTDIESEIAGCCELVGMKYPEGASSETILAAFTDHCALVRKKLEALAAETVRDPAETERELAAVKAEFKSLGSASKLEQFYDALLVAATFDTAIGHLPKPENAAPYTHIFIDEAGYASLARGMTAFACGCPVSFFGDHFQLPPICEMNAEKIKETHNSVAVWAVPVVAYSDMLKGDLEHLVYLMDRRDYSFDMLEYKRLLKTYRFGSRLAAILDSDVYHTSGEFEGGSSAPFEIRVLHGGKSPGEYKRRTSRGEADAISGYLRETRPEDGSYVILTPYKNQIGLLKRLMPDEKNNILTVHRAQGMEWDTVILSVCDTGDAYFVNSELTVGKCVLNTAISRAKRRLVLVCDTGFWSGERRQLIGKLISEYSMT